MRELDNALQEVLPSTAATANNGIDPLVGAWRKSIFANDQFSSRLDMSGEMTIMVVQSKASRRGVFNSI